MDKKYLTIKEASQFLDISTSTLRNWDRGGKLVADRHPVNNYRIYRMEKLRKFVEGIKPRPRIKKLKIKVLE